MAAVIQFPGKTYEPLASTWFDVGYREALAGKRQLTPDLSYDSRRGRAATIAREYRAGYAAGFAKLHR